MIGHRLEFVVVVCVVALELTEAAPGDLGLWPWSPALLPWFCPGWPRACVALPPTAKEGSRVVNDLCAALTSTVALADPGGALW